MVPCLTRTAAKGLLQTAETVDEIAFLKSFERFTKKRLGNAPQYKFLAKEQADFQRLQAVVAGLRAHLSHRQHLRSDLQGQCLLDVDPWEKRSADQIRQAAEGRRSSGRSRS